MARKQFDGGDGEDSKSLIAAYNEALVESQEARGPVSIMDMIQAFGGSRNTLARELAGISAKGTIASMSKADQTSYKTQAKNIDRWLKYASGDRGKQARNVEKSKATQNKMKSLFVKKVPPQGQVTASITGWIGYNGDWRYRTVSIPAIGKSVDTKAFNEAMQAGDTRAAYAALFDGYAPGLTVAQADNFTISYQEEGE
jgi:hypothetical protein